MKRANFGEWVEICRLWDQLEALRTRYQELRSEETLRALRDRAHLDVLWAENDARLSKPLDLPLPANRSELYD